MYGLFSNKTEYLCSMRLWRVVRRPVQTTCWKYPSDQLLILPVQWWLSSFNRGKLTRLQQPTLLGTTAEIDDDNLLTSSSPLHTSATIHTGTHIIETRTNHRRHICLPQQLLVKIVTQRSIRRKRRCQHVTNAFKIGKPFTGINGKSFKLLTLFVMCVRT